MNVFKKIASMVLTGAMALTMTASVFAASPVVGVSDEEQKILDEAERNAAVLNVPTSNDDYQKYYTQTVDYLQRVELSTDQVNAAIEAMNEGVAEVQAELKEKNMGLAEYARTYPDDLQNLKISVASHMQKILNDAGIDVKLVVNADGTIGVSANIPNNNPDDDNNNPGGNNNNPDGNNNNPGGNNNNPDGNNNNPGGSNPIVYSGRSVVVQTGSDLTATVIVAAAVVGAIAVCGIVAKKKGLFSGSEA